MHDPRCYASKVCQVLDRGQSWLSFHAGVRNLLSSEQAGTKFARWSFAMA